MTESKKIVIDLVNIKYDFSVDELIHANEFSQMVQYIEEQLSEDEESDIWNQNDCKKCNEVFLPNVNRTIMLNGSRGTGKTTFLQTLLKKLPEEQRRQKSNEKFCESLEILDYFDPTLIEEKASIFLTIVSLICAKVNKQFDKCCDKERWLHRKKAWRAVLDKFAKGLPAIDESKKNIDYWDDANQIMEKGLEDVRAAFDLRKNFRDFLKESLSILGKKSFLLIIDDVDTDSKRAMPLLETLRKYLSVNGIITIVSGDIQLFSTVVRAEQNVRVLFEKAGDSLLLKKQTEELTNQYLKKVLPIRYRISLGRLSQLINNQHIETPLTVLYSSIKSPISVHEFFKNVFCHFGIANNFQRAGYTDFLLNLPLRTQIDWMRLFKEFGETDSSPNDITFNHEKLISLFIDELLTNEIDVNLLVYNPNFINGIILDFLMRKDIIFESYQLQAISKDTDINAVIFTLSMTLSNYIHTYPSLVFDHFIKIGYIRNLTEVFQYGKKDKESTYSLKGLVDHMAVINDKDVRQMVCHGTAYLKGAVNNKKLVGVLDLDKADALINQKEVRLSDYIARLPYLSILGTNRTLEYSIFVLLGSINDLIRDFESGDNLLGVLLRISQPRDYAAFSNDRSETLTEEDEADSEEEEKVVDESDFDVMRTELLAWLDDARLESHYIASHVLAKVATRVYYTFSNIDTGKIKSLGDVMHLYIIALFNAVIIEEAMELTADVNSKFKDIKIMNRNVRTSSDVFAHNLKSIERALKKQELPLTRFILTCPILMFFINFEDKAGKTLLETYKITQGCVNENFYKKKGCYQQLNKIAKNGELIGEKSFSYSNFENIIDDIKELFFYEDFMKKTPEDLKETILKNFVVAPRNYKRSLEAIRKEISNRQITW